jgi:hypothetical protein
MYGLLGQNKLKKAIPPGNARHEPKFCNDLSTRLV